MVANARPETRLSAGGELVSLAPRLGHPRLSIALLAVACALAVGAADAVQPLAGVACLLVLALVLALVSRAEYAACLLVAVVPASAGIKGGLGLRPSEVMIPVLAALIIVAASRGATKRWSTLELLMLLYAATNAALGGLDLATRHATLSTEELGTLLGPLQFLLLVRAVNIGLPRHEQRVRAVHWLLGAATIVGLIALLQFANVGPTRTILTSLTGSSLYEGSLAEGVGRTTGPFNIWHELAGYLVPALLLAVGLLVTTSSRRARYCYGCVIAVTGLALLSTATISPLIAAVIGALYIFWKRGILHVAFAGLIPVVAVAALLFGGNFSGRAEQQYSASSDTYRIPFVPQTLAFRYALFQEQSAPALGGRLATGYGPDLPPQLTLSNFPHTETAYVTVLLRGGIPLLAIFLVLLLVAGRTALRQQRASHSDLEWCIATVALYVTAAWLVLQVIESYLLDDGPSHMYWAVVGLMLAGASDRSLKGDDGLRA